MFCLNFLFGICVSPALCGMFKNTEKIGELIVGGQPIEIEKVPYQAALYFQNFYFCSGSILTTGHVLTAAHCLSFIPLKQISQLKIRIGTSKMHSGGQLIPAKNFSLHPKFSRNTTDYDVGVISLKMLLNFTNVIQPVALATKEPKNGQEVQVSGWGYVREIGPTSRSLRSVTVKLVDRNICRLNYEGRIQVTKRMICAWGENKDACYGDSGGPLVYEGRLLGIVSMGQGCARKNFPGIYTSVANKEIKKFIANEINKKKKKLIFFEW